MMDGSTTIRPRSPDWSHTHTATAVAVGKYSTSIPIQSAPLPPHHLQHSINSKPHAPLPPLAHLDLAKIAQDDRSSISNESKHISPITTTTASSIPSLNSPASGYPGPPPPYSSLVTTSTPNTMGSYPAYQSQNFTEPRRLYDEEKERQPAQSLPSIHEALGKDPGPFYRGPPQPSPVTHQHPSMTAPSPTTPTYRSHANSISSHPPPNVQEPHIQRLSDPPNRSASDGLHREPQYEEPRRYPPEPQSNHRPPPIPPSPHTSTRPAPPQSQPSTPSFFPHPQTQHPPPPPPPNSTQQYPPAYAPAFSYPPPSSYPNQPHPAGTWRGYEYPRPEDEKRDPSTGALINSSRRSPAPYNHGESVKRQLETFDLELGFNEIVEGSNRILGFGSKYTTKAHHMQRSGIATALPSLEECDEMQNYIRSVQSSLERVREIVNAQQHALAEQRSREEATKARQASYGEQGESNGYEKGEGEGGFAGPELKKRRGRYAPPGRCHSCARSETPEWRRGPDGARTLCNACGLHYAKLTRKLGPKAPLPTSNLRPKENGASP